MNNENFHPKLVVPPVAHALHRWDEASRTLTYEYNGRDILSVHIPKGEDIGFRHGSDGNIQSQPFLQQLYIMVDRPVMAKVRFALSEDSMNMRPKRAGREQAILGQVGRPLLYGVNGLYDGKQDLLIEWLGCEWNWCGDRMGDGGVAEMEVLLGPKPWFVNLRMHYYRTHLGFKYHEPWRFRPDQRSVVGWCSWEAFRRDVTQKDLEHMSELFAKELGDYGFEYIQLDDGYEKMPIPPKAEDLVADGWIETNGNFPEGHDGIVKGIRDQGLIPGIWTNCNITNPEFAVHHADAVLKDNTGKAMLGEWIDYILDCEEETLRAHVEPYYRRLKELGYEYFKTDAIRHLLLDGLHEAVRQGVMTNEAADRKFRAFMESARKGIGDDSYFLASWGVLSECVGLVDACRIAMDANPTWAGFRMQLVESARWFHTQRILFLNDPDHICARGKAGWVRAVSSLTALSGGLYMLSDPAEAYTTEKLEIIRGTIPTLPTRAAETGPLDMDFAAFTWTKLHGFAVPRENPVAAEDITEREALDMAGNYPTMDARHPFSTLWAFAIEHGGKRWCVGARFATVPLSAAELRVEDLGLDPQGIYLAFDFWDRRYLGEVRESLSVKPLELGDCQIVALRERKEHPQIIGSDRHVSMDYVSVVDEKWTEAGRMLELKLEGKIGGTTSYWIHTGGWRFGEISLTDGAVTIASEQKELLELKVEFRSRQAALIIGFQ